MILGDWIFIACFVRVTRRDEVDEVEDAFDESPQNAQGDSRQSLGHTSDVSQGNLVPTPVMCPRVLVVGVYRR